MYHNNYGRVAGVLDIAYVAVEGVVVVVVVLAVAVAGFVVVADADIVVDIVAVVVVVVAALAVSNAATPLFPWQVLVSFFAYAFDFFLFLLLASFFFSFFQLRGNLKENSSGTVSGSGRL